jgi:hypothetical protein
MTNFTAKEEAIYIYNNSYTYRDAYKMFTASDKKDFSKAFMQKVKDEVSRLCEIHGYFNKFLNLPDETIGV